ncbi:PREDICTED: uncharacterized protein LOC109172159 [Ipomoea nil]|uniref:uncharacterized protein LOC109172159 n=1 Tax=Ipomoea nil TaxID=35883 RepID=UPI000900B6B6|nr:PREDICTED: uncharacterized protein LOC109172159 [Ipomoea nil]
MPITDEVDKMKKQRDQLHIFSWISGLDKEYDVLKSQLLGNKELDSLDQVFSMVQNASVNLGTDGTLEKQVFFSQGDSGTDSANIRGGRFRGRGRGRGGGRGQRACYNCGDPGHLRNQCPQLSDHRRFANSASRPEGTVMITEEELVLFNQLKLSSSQSPASPGSLPSPSTTFVQTGNPIACVSSSSRQWVIDSGASDHMSGSVDEDDYW